MPTIADHLDIDLPWPVSGRSLLGPPRRPGSVPLMRWKSNVVQPTDGSGFLKFDGPTGFASVLRWPGAATGRPDLRLYRSGPYGALVGEQAWPLVVPGDAGAVTLDDPLRYQVVDCTQPRTPWATVHGTIGAAARGRPIVVAFNGVIAGVATTGNVLENGRLEYWAMVAPTLLRDGTNLVQIFVVDGPRDAPRLRAAAITAG